MQRAGRAKRANALKLSEKQGSTAKWFFLFVFSDRLQQDQQPTEKENIEDLVDIYIIMKTKYDLVRKLPAYFLSHPVLHKVATTFQNSHVRFSSLFLKDGANRYLLRKDDEVHITLDWQCYSILRASSQLILITGGVLKTEKNAFLTQQSYGNQRINQLYRSLKGIQRQKLIAFTNSFSRQEVQQMVNPAAYELLPQPSFRTLPSVVSSLSQSYSPLLVEFGVQMMDRYFQELQAGEKNQIDTVLISTYHGRFHPRYKAGIMQFPLEKYYDLEWRSQRYPCQLAQEHGQVEFEIYRMKK